MKNFFKRACKFYLDNWWLPPTMILGWTLANLLSALQFYQPLVIGNPHYRITCIDPGYNSEVFFKVGLFFLMPGLLLSWGWLLHKNWRLMLRSFLLFTLFTLSIILLILCLVYF